MEHSMSKIQRTKSAPITRDDGSAKRVATRDDRTVGVLLAQEVIALEMSQGNEWPRVANKLFDQTIEARDQFVKTLREWLADRRKQVIGVHDFDKKRAGKIVASSTVRVSQLAKIAEAITAGMDRETVVRSMMNRKNYVSDAEMEQDVEQTAKVDHFPQAVGVAAMYNVAQQFVGSDARGRKPDTLLVKISKFIKANEPKEDTDPADAATWKDLVEWYNSQVK